MLLSSAIEVVAAEVYDKKATDLTPLLAKLMANKDIQAVVNWSIVPAQAIIAKNMRQAGWDVPLFQSHGFGNIKYVEAAGAAAEGIIFPAGRLLVADVLPDSDPQKACFLNIRMIMRANIKKPPPPLVVMRMMPLPSWPRSVETAGNDRIRYVMPLRIMKDFPGTGGVFSFSAEDHNGLDIDSFVMMTVKDGKFVLYEG